MRRELLRPFIQLRIYDRHSQSYVILNRSEYREQIRRSSYGKTLTSAGENVSIMICSNKPALLDRFYHTLTQTVLTSTT